MPEMPFSGRATITKDRNSIEITIPSKKNWFVMIFMTAWLGGWFMGETSAINQVFNGSSNGTTDTFITFWLIMWTIGGGFAITILLWFIGGQEQIIVDNGEIEIRKHIFGVGLSKQYRISDIKYLTINPSRDRDQWGRSNMYLLNRGQIEFDYGLKTIRFADSIDTAEARLIIDTLKQNQNFKETNFK